MVVAYKMQHPVRHKVLQMVGQSLALFAGLARADAEGQGDVAPMVLWIGRGGKGQHVGRPRLVTVCSVERRDLVVAGQQHHHAAGRIGQVERA